MSQTRDSDKAEADPPPPYQPPQGSVSVSVPSAQNENIQSAWHHVYRSFSGNYKIFLDDAGQSFFIRSHTFRMARLTIFRGNGDYEFEVANCNLHDFGHSHTLNILREVNKKSTAMVIRMTGDGQFTATVPVLDVTGTLVGAQRSFHWKNDPEKLSLVLRDTQTDQMVAAMHGVAFGLAKCFVLESQAPYGPAFDVLIVASAMAIYESKRKENSVGSGHGSRRRMHAGLAASQMGLANGAAMGGGGGC